MNKDIFKKGMGALLTGFPDKKFDLEIFWLFLQDLSDEEFLKAVSEIISTQKELYLGTNIIALIREKAKTKASLLPGEAWAIVKKEVWSVGHYNSPKFEDPLIAKAVSLIGWREICVSENEVADRAHFFQIYESLVKREQINKMLLTDQRCLLENKISAKFKEKQEV